ncbi:hypothetical protein [Fodinicola feengrottensis]|uniref:hypothetical protein n=1 Tax=Fodinicola feengrottensis TaxID=435914 RepID=UPI0024428560|nr:hypothetical protein [Fodinicola feengrottensis]
MAGTQTTATAVAEKPVGAERWKRVLSTLGSLQGYVGLALVLILGISTKGGIFLSQSNITNAVGAFASRGILGSVRRW